MNGLEIENNNKKISVGYIVYRKNGNSEWMIGVIEWEISVVYYHFIIL
jgi:hypothetical protein